MKRVILGAVTATLVGVTVAPATAFAGTDAAGSGGPSDLYKVICISNTVAGHPLPDICIPDPLES